MSLQAWREEAIAKTHDRQSFDCGYIAKPNHVLGFYAVAPSAVAHEDVPPALTVGLARHEVSGFKLARLATDITVAGQGLGGQLLAAY